MAVALDHDRERLATIMVREAGDRTWLDAVGEVEGAGRLCRYHAQLAERDFSGPLPLVGPAGETNALELHGRGVFVCISSAKSFLAGFVGQVAAALAAGNAVLAKPGERASLIAVEVRRVFCRAGLDVRLLHLILGCGKIAGAALVAHREVDGVVFSGADETAQLINRALAAKRGPIVPLIVETSLPRNLVRYAAERVISVNIAAQGGDPAMLNL